MRRLNPTNSNRGSSSPALAMARKIRDSARWQRVRDDLRIRWPLCADPFKAHAIDPQATTSIHHIEPLEQHPELAFDPNNLAPACGACHARLNAMERKGQATRELFVQRPWDVQREYVP